MERGGGSLGANDGGSLGMADDGPFSTFLQSGVGKPPRRWRCGYDGAGKRDYLSTAGPSSMRRIANARGKQTSPQDQDRAAGAENIGQFVKDDHATQDSDHQSQQGVWAERGGAGVLHGNNADVHANWSEEY